MNNNTNSKQYSAEDIQNYLTGRLTPLQMNAMEKAALEDAFLAEAMEGFAVMDGKNWQNQLAGLKQHFAEQSQAKVVILQRPNRNWMKAAAAVLLIGGAATLSYIFISKKDKVEIAQQINKEPTTTDTLKINTNPATLATETANETTNAKEIDNTTANLPKNTLAKTEQFTAVNPDIKADSVFVYTPSKTIVAPGKTDALDQKQTDGLSATAKSNAAPASVNSNGNINATNNSINAAPESVNNTLGEMVAADKQEKEKMFLKKEQKQFSRNFMAQVVAPDNSPLPFANVNIKSEDFGTYADVKGNFRLVSTDSVLLVEVKAAGYKPQYYTLQSSTLQNRIVLTEENNAFKDFTVITGNPAAKARSSRRATLLKDSVINVEPADGWDNYNTYADNNIEIPDDILQKNIHGRVELTFDVKPNGNITNVKVDKSLCNNCDEAAKRLLVQGPQWKVKNGQSSKGRLTVQF